MIFNYLRLLRHKTRPILWQKAPKKQNSHAQSPLVSSGYGSRNSSRQSSVARTTTSSITITLVDILKYLGFYCVMLDEKKARFVLLGAFGGSEYPPFRMTNLLELCMCIGNNGGFYCQDFDDNSAKFSKINALLSLQAETTKKEKELFGILVTPVTNMKCPDRPASLTCYKLTKPMKLFELYELNASLERNYYYVLSVRYTIYSEPDSCEYDTDIDEDFQWESNATIYNLGDPQPLLLGQYSLGDFTQTKMKNIRNKDVSNEIPHSRYLQDKIQAGTGKPAPKKRYVFNAFRPNKRYRKDGSTDEEDEETPSQTITPFPDFDNDFDDVQMEREPENEDKLIINAYIPDGEKEIEDGDIAMMLATDMPLPEMEVSEDMLRTIDIQPIDMDAIQEADNILTSISTIPEISIPVPSAEEELTDRRVRFRLSPISRSRALETVNKVTLKSCLKKAARKLTCEISAQIKLVTSTMEAKAIFEANAKAEFEMQRKKEKHEALIKTVKTEISKSLKQRIEEARATVRRNFNLPLQDFNEAYPDSRWRPVAAECDDDAYEALLKHLEYNYFWYWSGFQKLKDTFQNDCRLLCGYEILKHNKQIETFKVAQESRPQNRRRRRRSLDPVQIRFSYWSILNDEYGDNTEKTPFEHYYDKEFSSTTPTTAASPSSSQRLKRSASLNSIKNDEILV